MTLQVFITQFVTHCLLGGVVMAIASAKDRDGRENVGGTPGCQGAQIRRRGGCWDAAAPWPALRG
jgi:hypothetical protein